MNRVLQEPAGNSYRGIPQCARRGYAIIDKSGKKKRVWEAKEQSDRLAV
jgi:hypothetical protein